MAEENIDGTYASALVSDIDFLSIQGYLNLPAFHEMSIEELSQLNTVVAWAKSQNPATRVELLQEIRALEDRLGAPRLDETRLAHLYKWVRLDLMEMELKNEKQLYER